MKIFLLFSTLSKSHAIWRKLAATLYFAATLLIQDNVYAQEYRNFPGSAFELGKGIDIREINKGKVYTLFKNLNPIWENSTGTVSTTVYTDVISSEDELQNSLNLDVSLKARYMAYSLDASYKVNKNEILNNNSATILFKGTSDFGRQILTNITYKDLELEPKKLIDKKDYAKFLDQYGNYFVNAVGRTNSINIYVTLSSTSNKRREQIKASVSGTYKAIGTSVKASVDLNKELNQAAQQGRIRINIQSSGDTSGFAGLRSLITTLLSNPNPTNTIADSLKTYMKQFTRENSVISSYFLTPMYTIGIPRSFVKWSEETDGRIVLLAQKYNYLKVQKAKLEMIVSSSLFEGIGSKIEEQQIKSLLMAIDKDLYLLSKKKDNCLFDCYDSKDIFTCCNYEYKFYSENLIAEKYLGYLSLLNKEFNYPKILVKDQEYVLIDTVIPELKSKTIKVSFKYAMNNPTYPDRWEPYIQTTNNLVVNDDLYTSVFIASNYNIILPIDLILDDDGMVMLNPEKFVVLQTDAIRLQSDRLKIIFKSVANNFSPQDLPIRLLPKHLITVEVL